MSTRNLLLLTATITPAPGVPNLKRANPEERLQDYAKALDFYLDYIDKTCHGIIFVENSNSDISLLKLQVLNRNLTEKVEFISFYGLDYPPFFDRGYGEFKLLDYGMENSKLIKESNARTVIWKITGRYIVRNLGAIIRHQPSQFDLYCNYRNWPKHWLDTYFMAWTPDAYEICFRDVYHRLKTNVPGIPKEIAAEELLRSWLDQKFIRQNVRFCYRFRMTPAVEGVRGADNKGYSTDDSWKFQIRSALNKAIPWLWV